ncbi:hypothetical protein ACFWDG_24960 [Peribacillus sp. NPDC060186]
MITIYSKSTKNFNIAKKKTTNVNKLHAKNQKRFTLIYLTYVVTLGFLSNQPMSKRVRYYQLYQVKLNFDEISRIGVDNTYDGLIL